MCDGMQARCGAAAQCAHAVDADDTETAAALASTAAATAATDDVATTTTTTTATATTNVSRCRWYTTVWLWNCRAADARGIKRPPMPIAADR